MKLQLILIISVSVLLANSGVKNNPDPSWIYIDTWVLQANQTNLEGELTHNITDAFILIDDKVIGYFELPIKIPLLQNGSKKITLYPAIHNNGISSTKKNISILTTLYNYNFAHKK